MVFRFATVGTPVFQYVTISKVTRWPGRSSTMPALLDGAEMDKQLLAAALDESIALMRIEPLHNTVAHGTPLFMDASI
jgi:hypothetical protein